MRRLYMSVLRESVDNLKIKKMKGNSLKDIRRKLEDMNKRKEEWNMERDKMEK